MTDQRFFLQETALLNYHAENIQNLIAERGWNTRNEFDKIKEIYSFVKDEIKFGFNSCDKLSADRILKSGYGQCNTKTTLLMALLRAVGIPCRIHAFSVDKSLQRGILTGIAYRKAPAKLLHSWAEVYYDGKWYALEVVILDQKYLTELQKLYSVCTGAFCGFGVSTEQLQTPQTEWNANDTYIQHKSIEEDFGVFHSPDEMLRSHAQEVSGWKEFVYRYLIRFIMNWNVKRIRKANGKEEKPEPKTEDESAEPQGESLSAESRDDAI